MDAIGLYIRGLEIDAAKAQDRLLGDTTVENAMEALAAMNALQAGKLSVHGQPCPVCKGAGEIVVGERRASMMSPAEDVLGKCPACSGWRVVLPDKL